MGISNISSNLRPGVCTSTTRPSTPYEGQMIYETDTDMLAIWNGSAWRYIAATTATNGTVLQVVTAQYSTAVLNATSTYADTGLTATITPKSSSSKILAMVSQNGIYKTVGNTQSGVNVALLRGSTIVLTMSIAATFTNTDDRNDVGSVTGFYLDSPASTSAVTYKTQFKNYANATGVYVQEAGDTSTIALMEIAG